MLWSHIHKEGAFMLVLTRRIGQEIVIADNVYLTVLGVKGEKVRIGITAPPNVRADRLEVHDRRVSSTDAMDIANSDLSLTSVES